MSKVTKATFKSFLKKNDGKLLIKTTSHFDGTYDCTMPVIEAFTPLLKTDRFHENNLGYTGIWLTSSPKNYFTPYSKSGYTGYTVDNCCGSFIVVVKEEA